MHEPKINTVGTWIPKQPRTLQQAQLNSADQWLHLAAIEVSYSQQIIFFHGDTSVNYLKKGVRSNAVLRREKC